MLSIRAGHRPRPPSLGTKANCRIALIKLNLVVAIMTAILADALLQSARLARDLLTPLAAPDPAPTAPPADPLT
jgi:hypothetical protein